MAGKEIDGPARPVGEGHVCSNFDDEEWMRSWEVIVMSAMRLIRATLLAMRNRGTGSIADVALVASGVMGGNQTATGTHEAAPTRLNKSMARAIISDGIRRNALRPGTTTLPPVENRIAATADSEAKRRNFTQGQPVNRFSLGEVVATLPLWTASSETGFMVGAIVTVDDGQTL